MLGVVDSRNEYKGLIGIAYSCSKPENINISNGKK
jgi:hypothetical protein